jgi:hypothetical protein
MNEQQPTDHEIRDTLIQLHDELEQTQSLDENERALMRHLMNDIQDMLSRTGTQASPSYRPSRSALGRMETSIDVLEVSHPTLTAMIQKALDILNIAGI